MRALRKLFGSSRNEIWQQLSGELNAQYVPGSFWKGDRVQAEHGEWTIVLDKYVVSTGKVTVVYTRFRAPYVNPDGFRFTVYRRNLFADIAKRFGMQDVEIGNRDFDEAFIIKGTNEAKLRRLFQNAKIRDLVNAQRDVHFSVRDDEGWLGTRFPENTDQLYFTVHGVIKDVDRLKQLFDLFAETLDELCRIGSAYEKDPGVRL
jgi:hypothetical protein